MQRIYFELFTYNCNLINLAVGYVNAENNLLCRMDDYIYIPLSPINGHKVNRTCSENNYLL